MNEVLYEAAYRWDRHIGIPFLLVLGSAIMLLLTVKEVRKTKTVKGLRGKLCISALILLVSSGVATLEVATQVDMYQNIIVAYQEGNYETVEGPVENFVPMPAEGHATEHFTIRGIPFEYTDYSALQGYNNTNVMGGVITGNGQWLKIGYVYYEPWGCNVIVYIEERK